MAVSYISPVFHADNDNGTPLSGGKLYTYASGTTTPRTTYSDAAGGTPNTNPITLNSRGEAVIYLTAGQSYTFLLKTSTGTTIWSQDDIIGPVLPSQLSGTATYCTVGGTADAIELTPGTAIDAYATGQKFSFMPGSANTGPVTVAVSGLPGKALKRNGSTALSANDLVTGKMVEVEFDGINFQLLADPLNNLALTGSPTAPTQTQGDNSTKLANTEYVDTALGARSPVVGTFRNARMSVATAAATATFTADEIIVETALGGTTYRLASYSQSVNLATTGAGGFDSGGAPSNGFVSLYAIYKPSTSTTSILACNVTTSSGSVYGGANMPAGYTASALVGVWPTNGSGQFVPGLQLDRRVSFVPVTAYGANSGNPTSLTVLSLSSIVPPNAKTVFGVAGSQNTTDGAAIAIAATSTGIGQQYIKNTNVSSLFDTWGANGPFLLDLVTAQTLYWKTAGSGISSRIDIIGYSF